jgi:DNA-directed RNA polymerase specialized sigma24 family protein
MTTPAQYGDDGEIAWALDGLAPGLREVVVLRVFVGHSHREIAELLGISSAASEVRLCRALKALRLMLQRSVGLQRAAVGHREGHESALPRAASL